MERQHYANLCRPRRHRLSSRRKKRTYAKLQTADRFVAQAVDAGYDAQSIQKEMAELDGVTHL